MARAVDPSTSGPGTITTDVLGTLEVTRTKDWTILELGFIRRWTMGVNVEGTSVKLAWPAARDQVVTIGFDSEATDRMVLALVDRPKVLYLRKSHPRFDELLKQLED